MAAAERLLWGGLPAAVAPELQEFLGRCLGAETYAGLCGRDAVAKARSPDRAARWRHGLDGGADCVLALSFTRTG